MIALVSDIAAQLTTVSAQLATAERELAEARADAARINWIASIVNDDKSDRMEIARSLLRGGYEFGWWEGGKPIWFIGHGSLRQAIDAAISGGQEGR